ncbi:uncharacterized protein LOC110855150 [Folsomia candida]|uniref:Gag polyprotein n=1 Tax=Folsomia candida TaxID=158441 RepID=A0A226DV06_FOLCA|nr:uncharacterized protein LOC110855150 [Folsomia candida]OXA48900.1 Gag polyprotein [Folsomia candida]
MSTPAAILAKAVNERSAIKATLEWLEKQVANHATKPVTEIKAKQYLETVTKNQEKVEDSFERILANLEGADVTPHAKEYTTLLEISFEIKSEIGEILAKFGTPTTTTTTPKTPPTGADVKLPRLNLPQFDGKIEDWASFRDLFITAIHNNNKISDSQKLTYLKGQLKGEASRQVQSITITDANYLVAWGLLEDRYQNDRQLLFALLQRLTSQHQLTTATSSSLRQLIDCSKECMRSLEVLTMPVKDWDSLLLFLIHQKLDSLTMELFEQSLKDNAIPTLQSLFDFLEQRSRALEAGGSKLVKPGPANHPNKHIPQRNHVHHTNSPHSCKACGEIGHPLYKCGKFLNMSVKDRSDFVKKGGLCFNCLRSGHSSDKCSSTSTCRSCGGKHHSSLHRPKQPESTAAAAADKPLTLNHHSKVTNCFPQTLLATAIVTVCDIRGQPQQLRVLLDGGSDTHIVSSKAIRRLGLPWIKTRSRDRLINDSSGEYSRRFGHEHQSSFQPI